MWIVQLALRRPYRFIVAALLLLFASPLVILRTPVDIFPSIDIPVVSIAFQYTGMPASQFGDRITSPFERLLTTTVNDIEHLESTSLNGISVTKVFFQPNAKLPAAIAQVTAISQTVLRFFPTGITPPIIISYNASSVPILQLGLSSDKLGEQGLYDLGINYVRTAYANVPGAAIPYPFGGKQRQIMIDIDPSKLTARGLSPADVVNAISAQNLVLPSGTVKLGSLESDMEVNASPETVKQIADLPIKSSNGAIVYVRDIGSVHRLDAPVRKGRAR
jgi:multidrug efflux pump subunit AcrB